ncbi:hypothetical protein SCA6_007128 [Theobroma cacao]
MECNQIKFALLHANLLNFPRLGKFWLWHPFYSTYPCAKFRLNYNRAEIWKILLPLYIVRVVSSIHFDSVNI